MILIASSNDYANLGHEMGKALRSVGVDCIDVCLQAHPFGYRSESSLVKPHQMRQLASNSELVIIMHSCPVVMSYTNHRPFVVYHTGTRYRSNPDYYNRFFKHAQISLTDQTEFMCLNPKLKYIVCPVEQELTPLYEGGKLKVAHYPSNPDVKGSSEINRMMQSFKRKVDYTYSDKKVKHEDQVKRMGKCDVYVELFKPELNGKRYGCFGVTALEAASMGKIVVTNNLFPEVYESVYGRAPFTIVNTEQQFLNVIDGLIKMKPDMICSLQSESAEIAYENHSYKSTGNLLKRYLNV